MSAPSGKLDIDKLTQRDLHARACAMPAAFQDLTPADISPSVPASEAAVLAAVSQLRERFSAVKPTPEHSSKALDMLRSAKGAQTCATACE